VTKNPCGVYCFEEIEKLYRDLAQRTNEVEEKPAPKAKTFLHVMTEAYLSGGHTRLVERWLGSAESDERHSVVLVAQVNPAEIPERLVNEVKHSGGEVLSLKENSIVDKANELRRLSLPFEYVVLHHHPDDPVPLMAYCIKEYSPRVILFNHAGHLPWLGTTVAEVVICHEKRQQGIAQFIRKCQHTILVDLIVERNLKSDVINKKTDDDVVTLVAMIPVNKVLKLPGYDFVEDLMKVMDMFTEVRFVGIGLDGGHSDWREFEEKYGDRVELTGVIPFEEAKKWLRKADIYTDPFPSTSWTAIVDAISVGGLPVVVGNTQYGVMPFMEGMEAVCNSREEWFTLISELISDKEKRRRLAVEVFEQCRKECSGARFQEHVRELCAHWGKWESVDLEEFTQEDVEAYDEFRCLVAFSQFGKGKVRKLLNKWNN